MVELMKVLGKTIICMVKEYIHGVMEENMMENIIWIKSTVTECTIGLMEGDMKDTGQTVNSMEKENIFYQMESQR
jgi:hypothetical protein